MLVEKIWILNPNFLITIIMGSITVNFQKRLHNTVYFIGIPSYDDELMLIFTVIIIVV